MATKTAKLVVDDVPESKIREMMRIAVDVFLQHPIDSMTVTIARVPPPSKARKPVRQLPPKTERREHVWRRGIAGVGTGTSTIEVVCKNCRHRKNSPGLGKHCHPLGPETLQLWKEHDEQLEQQAVKAAKVVKRGR